MIFSYLTLLASISALAIALVTLSKSPNSRLHRWLFALIFFATVWVGVSWAINNYYDPSNPASVWLIRYTFLAASLTTFSILYFSYAVCNIQEAKRWRFMHLSLLILSLALGLSDLVVISASPASIPGYPDPIRGIGYPPLIVVTLYFAFRGILTVIRKRNETRGGRKMQLTLILLGLSLGAAIGVITNVIIPNISHTTYASRYVFLSVLIWTIFLVYAVVQHRFLDIRLAIVRSLGYLLSLATIIAGYLFLVIFFLHSFLESSQQEPLQPYFYDIILAILAALTFHPLRRVFDKLTKTIFYRDSYELREVLDSTNSLFVKSTDLRNLLKGAGEIFHKVLEPEFVIIILHNKTTKVKPAVFGRQQELSNAFLKLFNTRRNITVEDEIILSDPSLAQRMQENNVALVVRLETPQEKLGFIFFGYKSNGSIYTSQDLSLIRISASSFSLAIQNALRFEEIRSFNQTLQARVNEATVKLRRTNAKLQQLDEAKDEFISMASHQLRTPLTSVKGYLSLVLEGDAGDLKASQKKLLEEAYAGAQRMVYLIGDFLNVSRMKTGKFMLEYVNASLAKLIADEIEQLRDTAERRHIRIEYHEPEDISFSRFDENKIRQVIMNLVDNAIYYSKPGGVIGIELYKKDDQLTFKVKDQGIGVPAREQKDLFEKFYRASNARKVRPDGTGIGLFMIKKVILAHGGNIIFESKEGKGSTFGFTLPIKVPRKATKIAIGSPRSADK